MKSFRSFYTEEVLSESIMLNYLEFFKRNNRADFIDKAIAGTLKTEDGEKIKKLEADDPLIKYMENNFFKTKEMESILKNSYSVKGLKDLNLSKDGNGFSTGDGSKEPSGAEWEVIICCAYNMISKGVDKAEGIELAGTKNRGGDDVPMKWKDKYDDYLEKGLEIVENSFPNPKGVMHHFGSGVSALTEEWNNYFRAATHKSASASTKTPKTDMFIGNTHISLKKQGGSQLMSGGKGETLATLGFAFDKFKGSDSFNTDIEKAWGSLTSDITEHFYKKALSLPTGMSITKLSKGDTDLGKQIQEKMTGNTILTKAVSDMFNNRDLKYEVVKEAMTGQSKFKDTKPRATHMMKFNDGGFGKIQEIDKTLIDDYTGATSFNVSFKSSGEGGSAWIGLKGIVSEDTNAYEEVTLNSIIENAIKEVEMELNEGWSDFIGNIKDKGSALINKVKKWVLKLMTKIWKKLKPILTSSMKGFQDILGVKMDVNEITVTY
jgi:hypothetical protein